VRKHFPLLILKAEKKEGGGVTRLNSKQSLNAGYELVVAGKITHELTAREIETEYPFAEVEAFANGVKDALAGDDWRYDFSQTVIFYNHKDIS